MNESWSPGTPISQFAQTRRIDRGQFHVDNLFMNPVRLGQALDRCMNVWAEDPSKQGAFDNRCLDEGGVTAWENGRSCLNWVQGRTFDPLQSARSLADGLDAYSWITHNLSGSFI
ncbi:hypothetical protein ABH944_001947 [Caballeronia udeis]|uniref:Uncharacterized protein n=1 Tax=Caballeronia udeis TaxID=1232866 RepID=A0ABW8MF65_9BURK